MDEQKKDMKEDLQKALEIDFVPVYVRALTSNPILKRTPPSLIYLIISICIFLPYLLIKYLTEHQSTTDEILGISVCVAIICAAGVLLSNAYLNVKNTIILFPPVFTSEKQFQLLKKHMKLLFCSPFQNYVCVGFGLIGFVTVYYLNPHIYSGYAVFFFILVFFAFGFSGYGLWLAITTIYWIYALQSYGEFKLFPIPGRTLALRSTSKLVGIFSLSFSLQVSLFLIALFSIKWQNGGILAFAVYFLAIPFILFSIAFFVYPQLAIKNIVSKRKFEIIEDIEKALEDFNFRDLLKRNFSKEFENYSKIVELHYNMSRSQTFLIDLRTLSKFVSSIAIPIIIFLFEHFWTK